MASLVSRGHPNDIPFSTSFVTAFCIMFNSNRSILGNVGSPTLNIKDLLYFKCQEKMGKILALAKHTRIGFHVSLGEATDYNN